MGAQTKV